MFKSAFISENVIKKAVTSILLVGVVFFAFASMGGGGNKSKNKSVKVDVTPIRTTTGFTLKAGPTYSGSMIMGQQRIGSFISYTSVITYQKGNTTYILPHKYKLQTNSFQPSSLRTFNLRIPIH
jgi:hypothetical protein